jgi:endonuclease-3
MPFATTGQGDLFAEEPANSWDEKFLPLIEKYKNHQHPLLYKNLFQLMVMVILSAQDSDKHINQIAPVFFAAYPDFETIARATPEALHKFLSGVRNFANKCRWIHRTAVKLRSGEISLSMEQLTSLDGIGRKSANVIRREMNEPAEGIVVDLHVLRIIPRLGISQAKDGTKAEKDLMKIVSQPLWHHLGMAISFLGREICRPTNPKCPICVMNRHCPAANL